jgi:striatin 1/3/4
VYAWKIDDDENAAAQRYTVDHKDPKTNILSIPTTLSILPTDTNKLLIGYLNGDLSVVDVETGKIVTNILSSEPEGGDFAWSANHTKHMTSISCHPHQSIALTAHVDQCVRYFDINKGSCVHVLRAHRDSVTSVSVDNTGQYFVSSSHDQGVRFWDLSTRKIVQDLDPHQTHAKKFDESVHSVVYHPSQPVLASGGADSVIKIYS